jgi:hypothetical protein
VDVVEVFAWTGVRGEARTAFMQGRAGVSAARLAPGARLRVRAWPVRGWGSDEMPASIAITAAAQIDLDGASLLDGFPGGDPTVASDVDVERRTLAGSRRFRSDSSEVLLAVHALERREVTLPAPR